MKVLWQPDILFDGGAGDDFLVKQPEVSLMVSQCDRDDNNYDFIILPLLITLILF